METSSAQIFYLGFLLPGLFSLTLVLDGMMKLVKHEDGVATFLLGVLFLLSLAASYLFLFSK